MRTGRLGRGVPSLIRLTSPRVAALLLPLALSSTVTRRVNGQAPATLVGVVHDSSGDRISAADVAIVDQHALARSDSLGQFTLRGLKPGKVEVTIRRFGYVPQSLELTLRPNGTDTVDVVMPVRAEVLEAVRVSEGNMRRYIGIEDFYRRRARGIGGVFISRDDIEARNPSRLSEMMRMVPGVILTRNGPGGYALRFGSSPIVRRDCSPQYWVDGQRVLGAEIDDFPPGDIEGIELYQGPSTTPLQFSQGSITTCGTVVIWSRVPGT